MASDPAVAEGEAMGTPSRAASTDPPREVFDAARALLWITTAVDAAALALAGTVRATERVGRYGGEEFVVVVAPGDPDAFLDRLRHSWVRSRPHPVTFSAGIAPARPNPRRALEAADRAMYRAKEAGRARWHTATKDDYQ